MPAYIWNGVGLTAPEGWEPSALERDGLMLEVGGLPVCEIKWRTVQGAFSFEKHLKRLARGHKGVEMRGVPREETPQPWQEAVDRLAESGMRIHSFIWQTSVHRGICAALHNPATGLAALVQFFIHTGEDETVAAEALATFRDYSGGKTVPWAMFGLAARLPAEFVLDTFSFKPGHYLVKLWRPKSSRQAGKLPAGKGPGTSVVFERFAPANVLLKGKGLADWIQGGMENAPPETLDMVTKAPIASWSGIAKTSFLRRALRREQFHTGRVWTTDESNAILAVTATGTVPADDAVFNEICESYVLVQET